jgi:ABC-type Mn2+/Zn2+ transport system ATPase subunit
VTDASLLVRLDDVAVRFDAEPVVQGVSFTVDPSTFLGLVGPSGAGKTSVLRVLAGTLQPSAGRVARHDRCTIGYVPQVQSVDWDFPITVTECVLLARAAMRWRPGPTPRDRADARETLERLGIGDLGDRRIRELSGGQQQRVFLARALLQRPALLLLDEPTSGVDLRTRHEVMHLLGELHRDGLAIVITTHDLNGVATHLPTIACLNRRIVHLGSPAEVLTPSTLEATYGAPLEVLTHAGLRVVIEPGLRPASGPEPLPALGPDHRHDIDGGAHRHPGP